MKYVKSFLISLIVLLGMSFSVQAQPLNFTFNNAMPVSVAPSNEFPGCRVIVTDYTFDVTMLGYNLPTTSCTQTNLLSDPGYLTIGQYGGGVGGTGEMVAPVGVTFTLNSIMIKGTGIRNNITFSTIDDQGNYSQILIKGYVGVKLFTSANLPGITVNNLVSFAVKTANNKAGFTAIQITDNR